METIDAAATSGGETEQTAEKKRPREKSGISFPYMDLKSALEFAQAVYARNGSSECRFEEVAGQMGLSPTSSGFRVRVATARLFGLTQKARGSNLVCLTDLGLRAVDASTERKAKADAFLAIPLFKKVYEEYLGMTLPPPDALRRQMESFGVPSGQTDRARQVLLRSAETAGFFENGRDKLMMPGHLGGESDGSAPTDSHVQQNRQKRSESGNGASGPSDDDEIDPVITALLAHLPPRKTMWPKSEQDAWIELLRGSLRFIYYDEETSE